MQSPVNATQISTNTKNNKRLTSLPSKLNAEMPDPMPSTFTLEQNSDV